MAQLEIPDGTKTITPNQISREPERKSAEKVVRGDVKIKKKSRLNNFLGSDIHTVLEYAWYDKFLPMMQETLADTLSNAITMLFTGDTRGSRSRDSRSRASVYHASYDRRDRDDRRPSYATSRRDRFDIDDIVFEERADAEDVIDELSNHLRKYNTVTVANLFESAGKPTNSRMWDWGWDSMRDARVRTVRDGYIIELPSPRPLER